MTRREMLAATALTVLKAKAGAPEGKAILGGSPTSFNVRGRAARQRNEVFDVVEHCHSLGLKGAEAARFVPTPEAVRALRQKIENYGMVVVLNIPLPKTESDLAQFETAVAGAKRSGRIRPARRHDRPAL